jgi:hypothetical protein
MFIKPKCINCNQRKPIVNVVVIATMAGDIKLNYCHDCNNEKAREEAELEKKREIQRDKERKEYDKQRRYEYLKREIELSELEEKAKLLGID